MKSATFKLSKAQQIFFAIVLGMSVVFAGCTENPSSNIPVDSSNSVDGIEGKWIEIQENGISGARAELTLSGTQGIYLIPAADEASPADYQLYMLFEYENDVSNQALHIRVHKRTVLGKDQPSGFEEVQQYSLGDDRLRIFDKTFVRQ